MTGGMEEAEGDTAIDATAKQDGDFKALMGHRTGQVRAYISIEAVWSARSLGDREAVDGAGGEREGSEEEESCRGWRARKRPDIGFESESVGGDVGE